MINNTAILFEEEDKAFRCIRELIIDRRQRRRQNGHHNCNNNNNDDDNDNEDDNDNDNDEDKDNADDDDDNDEDYSRNDQALSTLRKILDKYLELPSLLDRYIASMVRELTDAACSVMSTYAPSLWAGINNNGNDNDTTTTTNDNNNNNTLLLLFWDTPLPRILSALYSLSKVRGRKKIQKFLPHQVENVEPVLNTLIMLNKLKLLENNNCNNINNYNTNGTTDGITNGNASNAHDNNDRPQLWESIYTVWNWMGILGKVPFDCTVVVDISKIDQFLLLAMHNLSETGPIRDGVSSCLACWLTRPDLDDNSTGDTNSNNRNNSNNDNNTNTNNNGSSNPSFRNSFQQWSVRVLNEYVTGRDEVAAKIRRQSLEKQAGNIVRDTTKRNGASTCTSLSHTDTIYTTMGVLQTLVTILKISTAERDKVLASIEPYWSSMEQLSSLTVAGTATKIRQSNILLRKYLVKWWTRLGMLYLPPRIISWRYQRGRRSLKENLKYQHRKEGDKKTKKSKQHLLSSSSVLQQQHNRIRNATTAMVGANNNNSASSATAGVDQQQQQQSQKVDDDGTDYFFYVPDRVETAMGYALASLTDSSTVVRWSAAKGVGRITNRLPAICAEDVIDATMALFTDVEKDNNWHGACLALAELARRGLLLPHRLTDVIPKLVEGLQYDIPRRETSVGVHVRDAACYTYWALARAYAPSILRPYVSQLGRSVVVSFLFDREVNCRRAASAAFQEMVGRQGAQNFKDGISILTKADYFSLGNRTACFGPIAVHVAQFEEYQTSIIHHLCRVSLSHWDRSIRILASKSLNQLTMLNPNFIVNEVLPYLMDHCFDEQSVHMRHGATLGLAEIVLAFGTINLNSRIDSSSSSSSSSNNNNKTDNSSNNYLSPQLLKLIADTPSTIEKKRLYRGKGGEQMRTAVCRLIECIALSRILLTVHQQVRLLDSIDACLPHPNEDIQKQACHALSALMLTYFPVGEKGPSERLQKRVVDKFVNIVRTGINPASTRGYSLALGYLPAKLLAPTSNVLDGTLSCLCQISHPNAKVGTEKDAETRRNALLSLSRICESVGLMNSSRRQNIGRVKYVDADIGLSVKQIKQVFTAYIGSMDDYNTDQRGDVGSKCRLAAMNGLVKLAIITSGQQQDNSITGEVITDYFSTELCARITGMILKQLAEKLDFVRSEAARCLLLFLNEESPTKIYVAKRQDLIDALAISSGSNDGLPNNNENYTNWADPLITFPIVMKAADISEYFGYVISGLILSVGGLTKSVTQNSSSVLARWTRCATESELDRLGIGKSANQNYTPLRNIALPVFKKEMINRL